MSIKKIILAIFWLGGFLLAVKAHQVLAELTAPPPSLERPSRIVSLAPSVTETLFAIGMGDQVVGVTMFCKYPPEATRKPKVAGFSDVNFEAVLRQKPDLVALPVDKISSKVYLEQLGLNVMTLDTRSLTGLVKTIDQLGQKTGHFAEAEKVLSGIKRSIDGATKRAEGQVRPKVLFSIMHSYQGLGYITEINAVGQDGFFSELIEIAGGENVYKGGLPFPRLSREAIIFLNPEVIVDIIPKTEDLEAVRADWMTLTTVSAIKNNRLIFLIDESDTVPGPRVNKTLDKLSLAFHPGNYYSGH